MKNKGKIVVIIALLLAVAVGLYCFIEVDDKEITIEKIEEVKHNGVIEGKVIDAANNTIEVRDINNHKYLIERNDEVTSGDALLVGDDITVNYTGDLKEDDNVQNIAITKIVLKASVVKNVNNQPKNPTVEQPKTTQSETIAQMIQEMTLEEKIGQMFFVRCPDKNGAQFVKDYQIGGYILFGQDFKGKSEKSVINTIKSYQKNAKIPLLIGTDEEGGTVTRVSTYFRNSKFQSPQTVFKKGGFEEVTKDTLEKSEFLQKFGINVNFAPVSDVSTNKKDFIYDRSFGKNATETAKYVRTIVEAMEESNEGSVLKHFPGYGNNKDTHTEICIDNRSLDTFEKSDLIPFKEGIDSGADSILVSHNIVKCLDTTNPSSLSPKVHKLIRDELGFDGVIMTDDLLMEGVRKLDTDANIAVKAVIAGNDMLLSSDAKEQIEAVIKAVKEGYISENQIDHSVMRVLSWKEELGLLKVTQ